MGLDLAKVVASIATKQSSTNTPFGNTTQGTETLLHEPTIDTDVINRVLLSSYTIAAAGTQGIDLRSFTNLLNVATTATKVIGILLKGTGSGAKMKIEPYAASNPVTWFWTGTTPAITLTCGTQGCSLLVMDGAVFTLTATDRSLLVTNTGSASLTLTVEALVGT
jgi:hypothetical protein